MAKLLTKHNVPLGTHYFPVALGPTKTEEFRPKGVVSLAALMGFTSVASFEERASSERYNYKNEDTVRGIIHGALLKDTDLNLENIRVEG